MNYNIVSNNFVGSSMCNLLKYGENTVFYKTNMKAETFLTFMTNYPDVNFDDTEFSIVESKVCGEPVSVVSETIDSLPIKYSHYIYDASYDEPTVVMYPNGSKYIKYKDIVSYTEEKYASRLALMNEVKENPIFILSAVNSAKVDDANQIKFIENESYPRILVTYLDLDYDYSNAVVIRLPERDIPYTAKYVANIILTNPEVKEKFGLEIVEKDSVDKE